MPHRESVRVIPFRDQCFVWFRDVFCVVFLNGVLHSFKDVTKHIYRLIGCEHPVFDHLPGEANVLRLQPAWQLFIHSHWFYHTFDVPETIHSKIPRMLAPPLKTYSPAVISGQGTGDARTAKEQAV